MSSMPDVSVVIPTCNRRRFLEEAIRSCFAENDRLNMEVVVVEGGSTDDTRYYLRALETSVCARSSRSIRVRRQRATTCFGNSFRKSIRPSRCTSFGTTPRSTGSVGSTTCLGPPDLDFVEHPTRRTSPIP